MEVWLVELEDSMIETVRCYCFGSWCDYPTKPFDKWLQLWPGQVVICVFNLYWTQDITRALQDEGNAGLGKYETVMKGT